MTFHLTLFFLSKNLYFSVPEFEYRPFSENYYPTTSEQYAANVVDQLGVSTNTKNTMLSGSFIILPPSLHLDVHLFVYFLKCCLVSELNFFFPIYLYHQYSDIWEITMHVHLSWDVAELMGNIDIIIIMIFGYYYTCSSVIRLCS